MNPLLRKAIEGKPVTQDDIEDELYEVCSSVHSSCNEECPVYAANGNRIPNKQRSMAGCDCFKNGAAMLRFLRESK